MFAFQIKGKFLVENRLFLSKALLWDSNIRDGKIELQNFIAIAIMPIIWKATNAEESVYFTYY